MTGTVSHGKKNQIEHENISICVGASYHKPTACDRF